MEKITIRRVINGWIVYWYDAHYDAISNTRICTPIITAFSYNNDTDDVGINKVWEEVLKFVTKYMG